MFNEITQGLSSSEAEDFWESDIRPHHPHKDDTTSNKISVFFDTDPGLEIGDYFYINHINDADEINEIELLNILNPLINSDSVWKPHALYLVAEFFYSKGEIEKSKDFFQKIVLIENVNTEIAIKAQRRLNRDLSD